MGKNSAIPKNLYTYLYDFECLKILKENVFDTYFFPSSVPIHHSIAFEAIKNYTFFDILAKCALYWWIQVPEIKSRNTTWVKRFFILAFSIFDKFFKKFCSYLLHLKKSSNMPNNCKNILQSCVEIIIPPWNIQIQVQNESFQV